MYQKAEFTTEILVNQEPNGSIENLDESDIKLYEKIMQRLKFMLVVYEAVDFNKDPKKFGKVLFSCVEYMKIELKMYSLEVFTTYISSFIDSFAEKIKELCKCFECGLRIDCSTLKKNLAVFFENEAKSENLFHKSEIDTANCSNASSQQRVNLINSLNSITKPAEEMELYEVFEHLVILSVLSDEFFIQSSEDMKHSIVGLFLIEIDSQLEWNFSEEIARQTLIETLDFGNLKIDVSKMPECFKAGYEYLESLKYFKEISDRQCLTDYRGKSYLEKFKNIFGRVLQFCDE